MNINITGKYKLGIENTIIRLRDINLPEESSKNKLLKLLIAAQNKFTADNKFKKDAIETFFNDIYKYLYKFNCFLLINTEQVTISLIYSLDKESNLIFKQEGDKLYIEFTEVVYHNETKKRLDYKDEKKIAEYKVTIISEPILEDDLLTNILRDHGVL